MRASVGARLKYTPEVINLIHERSFKWSLNAGLLTPSIRWLGQQIQGLGIIARQPNYAEYFVPTHVDAVLRELGKVPDHDFEKVLATPLR